MVASLERIERDLAALDLTIAAIGAELHRAYADYLSVLGQAVRQQLILASYYVCTQGYPEAFLRLSATQRSHLQQALQHLAQQVQAELLAQLYPPVVAEPPDLENRDRSKSVSEPEICLEGANFAQATALSERSLTPIDLAQWQQGLEQAINHELQLASHAANRLLQQTGILSRQLPEPILQAATKAEMSEVGGHPPNVLALLMETGDDRASNKEGAKSHATLQVIAIHLRLSEIEFADPIVSTSRTQLRSLSARLKTLARDYQKKQREQSVAQAQAAWRSTWTDSISKVMF
jgi:hypothetical protein